ncbi:hypothetical protein LWF01_10690 [Saxibacter everestensis]|uniref:Uncharacterized protein n=1 Tax=Saxibacter everestensis TaxID=2909229 RepID=A0ABY8QNR8_9MICO|nr:hypothetical protein LWF01_10690 [Brevibacteriaceae bacterium ZFBP1038]
MSTNNRPPAAPRSALTVQYDPGRAARQLVGFGAATLIMIGLAALGVWMIVASLSQMATAGKVIGCGFGVFFILVAVVTLVGAAEVLSRIIQWSRQADPLLSFDAVGISGLVLVGGRRAGVDADPIAWSDIESIKLEGQAPRARRSSNLANLDVDHRIGQAAKRGLDRTAGLGLGMRDGRRWILVELVDGRSANRDLTLPIGPASFARLAPQIADHVRRHDARILLQGAIDS